MSKIRVAVFGASGYAGEELLRLLLRHNQAEIAAITSRKNAGEPVSTVFPRFTGLPLKFIAPDEAMKNCDFDAKEIIFNGGEMSCEQTLVDKDTCILSSVYSDEEMRKMIIFEDQIMLGSTYGYQQYFIQRLKTYDGKFYDTMGKKEFIAAKE